jgi:MFS family permease
MLVAPMAGRFSDRIGGKYILTAGISLFTVGMGTLAFVAGPDSTWINFLPATIIAGAGMGMTFAPMTTVAMRNISPRNAGAASGVLNTIRQLGAAIGSAVIGALLQNRLAISLHDQAVSHASALPAAFRSQFITAFSSVGSNGFEIGTGQNGAKLPANIPPAAAHQLAALAHDVFVTGYIDAMKSTFILPIAFLAVTVFTTLLIRRRPRAATQELSPREEVKAAAS